MSVRQEPAAANERQGQRAVLPVCETAGRRAQTYACLNCLWDRASDSPALLKEERSQLNEREPYESHALEVFFIARVQTRSGDSLIGRLRALEEALRWEEGREDAQVGWRKRT